MEQVTIAIPTVNGQLSPHFGHCEIFTLFEVDAANNKVIRRYEIPAPPHEPGLLPVWLHEKGVHVIIAGGMGQRAQGLFAEKGIRVIVGAPTDDPAGIIKDYLRGNLQIGENICDH